MRLTKLIFFILIVTAAIPAVGQTKFDASEIDNALDTITKVRTGRTIKWAENVAKLGNVDSKNNICWILNVTPSDSLYYGPVADCILNFVKKYSPALAIDNSKTTLEHVAIEFTVPRIMYSDGTLSFAMVIDAKGEMDIDLSPRKITLTTKVFKYVNAEPYGLDRNSNDVVWMAVGDVSPFKNRSERKFWSRAYINSNYASVDLTKRFVSFLSENYNSQLQK